MRLREITQRPIVEFAPAWALLDLIFGASPAGQYSDRSPGSLVYHGLSGNPKYKDQADSLAKEFNELLNSKGPTDPQVQQIYQNATGKSLFSDHPYLNPMSKPRDGGNPGGMTTAPKQPDVKQTQPIKPPVVQPDVKQTQPIKPPVVPTPMTKPEVPKNAPNLIKPGADVALAKELPAVKDTKGLTDVLGKYTKMPQGSIMDLASKVGKYAIPAAGIMALLYGGKKLYDYLSKEKKEALGEVATPGATSAGNVAVVVNPKQAYGHRKRDKNGVPKAPQKTNPDGTAKNALDISNNLMGGETIKR